MNHPIKHYHAIIRVLQKRYIRPTHKRRRPAQIYAKGKLYLITILQLLEYVQSVCSPTAISAFAPCFAELELSITHKKTYPKRIE